MKLETLGHLLSPLYRWERELLESGICSFAMEWFLIPKDLKKKNKFKEVHKGHLEIEKFHRGISCTIICPQTNYDIIKALRFAQRFVKYAKTQDKWSETFSGDTEKLPAWNKASIDLLKLTKKEKKCFFVQRIKKKKTSRICILDLDVSYQTFYMKANFLIH